MKTRMSFMLGILIFLVMSLPLQAAEIIHDSEHYVLLKQYKGQWAQQDAEIQEKLDALRKKYGKPPNIIHIMWDDTPVGEIGIPAVQKVRGWETPVMKASTSCACTLNLPVRPPAPR